MPIRIPVGCLRIWTALAIFIVLMAAGCSRVSLVSVPSRAYEGTPLDAQAPDFRLTDQNGKNNALSNFRSKVVALAFLDPICTDVCPLIALHFRQTSEALGKDAEQVIFLVVNTNVKNNSVADVVAATRKWGVESLANWHYMTGSKEALEPVWEAFHIVAEGPPKPGKPQELSHTPGIFVIDQQGRERWYISIPLEDATWDGPALSDVLQKHIKELLQER